MTPTKAKKRNTLRYHTIAHEFLELNEIPLLNILDKLLQEASAKIKTTSYSEPEVPGIIDTIERIFTVTPIEKKENVYYLNHKLQEKKEILYSALGPLAYTAVAEALELPFVAVKDLYVTVIWNFSEDHYLVRTIDANRAKRMMELLDLLDQPPANSFRGILQQENNFKKGKGLSKPETLARYYNNIGIAWGKKKEVERAISCFSKAIELNPQYIIAYCNRSNAYLAVGDEEKAIDDACEAYERS